MAKEQGIPNLIAQFGWVSRGIGGGLNLLERFEPNYAELNEERVEELRNYHRLLGEIIERVDKAREKQPIREDTVKAARLEAAENQPQNREGWGG